MMNQCNLFIFFNLIFRNAPVPCNKIPEINFLPFKSAQ